jgi:putative tryptophan/tyrosine transport system substrate-binding protein
MRRREFITLFAGAAAWVSLARAQEPRRVIGFLGSASFADERLRLAAFVQALKDTGFIEGNNISIESRWAEGQYNRLPSLAGELVSRGVAVIVSVDAPAASAAKAATKTIPMALRDWGMGSRSPFLAACEPLVPAGSVPQGRPAAGAVPRHSRRQ